jgi:hypothetical protein
MHLDVELSVNASSWYVAALLGGLMGGAIGALSLHTERAKGAGIGAVLGAGLGIAMRATIRHELPGGAS